MLFSQQLPGPTRPRLCPSTCLILSTENGTFQRQVAYLCSTITQVHFQASCVPKQIEMMAQDSGKLAFLHGSSLQHLQQNKHRVVLDTLSLWTTPDIHCGKTAFHLAGLTMINELFKTLNPGIKDGLACLVPTCVSLKWS